MVVAAQTPSSPSPPPIGSLIDNGALELVEVLGYGGYGIVYRAIDTYTSHPTSYAVKCLPHSQKRSAARQRQLHIREITLHQLASAHPGVVTLHRVIEDYQYTWIVMDYCSDGDLFTQILHNRRYLGQNELIKEVFLQLLDAVEYCHSLNIYHRDLKPENVLCFDDGLRLAITDFGLATTDRMSTEFRTGSVYHMSPECQGAEFAPTKSYSPLFNDIWSLGIILLNLITGRNPWKSASPDDCTFQAYLKDPRHFLPTVLPISEEVNKLLVRTLEVDWRRRITLREMRLAVKSIKNFYSPDALFEDSMARCPWEAGVNMDDEEGVSDSTGEAEPEVEITEAQEFPSEKEFNSRWSHGSDSDMVFRGQPADDGYSWTNADSRDATCAAVSSTPSTSQSPSSMLFARRRFDSRTPSVPSNYSLVSSSPSIPSPPVTPGPEDTFFGGVSRRPARLTLDMEALQANYYDGSITMISARSSPMHTALESATQLDDFDPYSSFYVAPSEKTYAMTDASDDMGMLTDFDEEEAMDAASVYSFPEASTFNTFDMSEPMSARPESPVLGLSLGLPSSETTAVDSPSNWSTLPSCPPSEQQTPAFSFLTFATTPNSSARIPSLLSCFTLRVPTRLRRSITITILPFSLKEIASVEPNAPCIHPTIAVKIAVSLSANAVNSAHA
ncbi:hypothetical protein EW026_g2054 [Hermanssonia centrifuga]|uniref:Protein kinase domain-containing protein n=1 Tax=Hermanssonia centrifuga TaxID=98765 RepID=A0A4S4KQ64_9APHY|nr:hypothetical protein EW026_g2054 [Hermanssonia centrifuga]